MLNGLKNRCIQDILIASVDGLSGFSEAIAAAYPKTEIQRCIIHQLRALPATFQKNAKAFTAALKPPTKEIAQEALNDLERV